MAGSKGDRYRDIRMRGKFGEAKGILTPNEDGCITFVDIEFAAGAELKTFPTACMGSDGIGNSLMICAGGEGYRCCGVVDKG